MKRLAYLMLLGACGQAGVSGACDLSRFDDLVGQDASVLSQQSGDFVVIESGDVWTGGTTGRQTIVFLDGDGNILSFGCG